MTDADAQDASPLGGTTHLQVELFLEILLEAYPEIYLGGNSKSRQDNTD